MKFLTALIQHSRQPARGGDRPPVALQAPTQPDLGSGDVLAAEEPAPMPGAAAGQLDFAPPVVDSGEGDRRSLPAGPRDEREPEADSLAAIPAQESEPALPGAGPEASTPEPDAAMPATRQLEPQAREAMAAAVSPARVAAAPPMAQPRYRAPGGAPAGASGRRGRSQPSPRSPPRHSCS